MIQFETRALLSKCMMQAGYELQEAREGTASYYQVAIKAWELERQHLQQHIPRDLVMEDRATEAPGDAASAMQQQKKQKHSHDHAHDHTASTAAHAHVHDHTASTAACFDGHHLHDLEGKCGHKAIVHKPSDGPAHVDFVLGNKVECYRDTPVGSANTTTVWPSKYRCDQLDCPGEETHRV